MRKKLGLLYAASLLGLGFSHQSHAQNDAVTIGVLTDLTGIYSQVTGKGSVIAAQMAVEDFGGKVLGKPIKVLYADHLNKPDIAATKAREWVDKDGVNMITDITGSATGIAVQKLLAEKNFIIMNTGSATSALTDKECSPYSTHWAYDTKAVATGTANAILQEKGDSWFFITADYAFGHVMQADSSKVLQENGGKVVGAVRHPLAASDFSSFLVQAMASKAKVVVLANTGGDATNAIRQAKEFGLIQKGQQVAPLLIFETDIKGMGLDVAQGLKYTTGYYWDYQEQTRAWSKRFFARHKAQATTVQAGTYSATLQYLKAVQAVGSLDRDKVMAKLREMPVNDMFARNGKLRADGLMVHDMYLAEVKTPAESKGEWDIAKVVRAIPGDKAFPPLSESQCPYLKK